MVMHHLPFEEFLKKLGESDIPEEILGEQYVRVVETCVRRIILDCMIEFGPEVQDTAVSVLDAVAASRTDLDALIMREATERAIDLAPYVESVVNECVGA